MDSKPGEEAKTSLTRFYKGDLLFGAMRPYFHKVCIAPFDGATRTTAFVLYAKQRADFGFAVLLLHRPETIDFATNHSTGSTIPYAVWANSMETMPVVLPPHHVRIAVNDLTAGILDRIQEPYFECRTLAALRDTLLPKLISGELRVRDAEKFIKRVSP
ncbi:MAG: restriction endonuclease subunit S [Candidatus Eisenbacteria bacterium]|nr:restriction endonuclease subunit S [Candidatus Eisenbacteria bacterium]